MKNSTKILLVLLLCGLLPSLALATLSVVELMNLSAYSMGANVRLATRSVGDAESALLAQAEKYMERVVYEQAFKFENVLQGFQGELFTLAGYLQFLYSHEDRLQGNIPPLPFETLMGELSDKYMLAPDLEASEELLREVRLLDNCRYLFPRLLGEGDMKNNIYVGTESGISYRYSRSNAYNSAFDPRQRNWYSAARQSAPKPVWVGSYLDAYGSLCVTCAMAYYKPNGEIAGVIAMDLTVAEIQSDIMKAKLGESGFAFLLNADAHVVVKTSGAWREGELPADLSGLALPPDVVAAIMARDQGILVSEVQGKRMYLAHARLPSTGWSFGIAVERDEILAPVAATRDNMDAYIAEAQSHIDSTLRGVLLGIPAVMGVSAIFILLMAYALSRVVARPEAGPHNPEQNDV